MKGDVNVQCTLIGNNKYRCAYTPKYIGSYLLYISWAERQVVGSPYAVNVLALADAGKVVIGTENLQQATMMGGEISTVIDTRRAGTGERSQGGVSIVVCSHR